MSQWAAEPSTHRHTLTQTRKHLCRNGQNASEMRCWWTETSKMVMVNDAVMYSIAIYKTFRLYSASVLRRSHARTHHIWFYKWDNRKSLIYANLSQTINVNTRPTDRPTNRQTDVWMDSMVSAVDEIMNACQNVSLSFVVIWNVNLPG